MITDHVTSLGKLTICYAMLINKEKITTSLLLLIGLCFEKQKRGHSSQLTTTNK